MEGTVICALHPLNERMIVLSCTTWNLKVLLFIYLKKVFITTDAPTDLSNTMERMQRVVGVFRN